MKLSLRARLSARARKIKTDIPTVYLALRDTRAPKFAKALALLTVAYALSPIDLVPDFIPIFGYLDDLLIVPALLTLTISLLPPEVLADCRAQAQALLSDGLQKHWQYAIPIVLFWLIVSGLLIKAIF